MEKASVDSASPKSKMSHKSVHMPDHLSMVVTPAMITDALKSRLPPSQRFDHEMSKHKREAFDLNILDEKCRNSRESLKNTSQKALKSGIARPEDSKVPTYTKCSCSFCGKQQAPDLNVQPPNTDISAKDEKDRNYLLNQFMKHPVDVDFVFIVNRLRNYKQEDYQMYFPVADTVIFHEGVCQFIVRSTRSRDRPPSLKYYLSIPNPISKQKITSLFESRISSSPKSPTISSVPLTEAETGSHSRFPLSSDTRKGVTATSFAPPFRLTLKQATGSETNALITEAKEAMEDTSVIPANTTTITHKMLNEAASSAGNQTHAANSFKRRMQHLFRVHLFKIHRRDSLYHRRSCPTDPAYRVYPDNATDMGKQFLEVFEVHAVLSVDGGRRNPRDPGVVRCQV